MELLVVIAIIGVLVALLLPAVQQAREAARRMQCTNNIKQMCLAALNHESTYGYLPSAGKDEDWNYDFSWLVRILPYTEQSNLYDRIPLTESNSSGWLGSSQAHKDAVYDQRVDTFLCPSSTLNIFTDHSNAHVGTHVMRSNYTGINGIAGFRNTGAIRKEKGAALRDISDGTTNTIIVGEQSGILYEIDSSTGAKIPQDCRADGNHGWTAGFFNTERYFNTTCGKYAINEQEAALADISGSWSAWKWHTPITSAHPGGANCGMVDGSVQFLPETIPVTILNNLMRAEDGNVIEPF